MGSREDIAKENNEDFCSEFGTKLHSSPESRCSEFIGNSEFN
jgi:hypothetical protein